MKSERKSNAWRRGEGGGGRERASGRIGGWKGRQEKNSYMCGRGENKLGGKRKEKDRR